MAERSKVAASKAESPRGDIVGSNPTAPAIYIDNESKDLVNEDWWPHIKAIWSYAEKRYVELDAAQ
jgi:hypothetical protein